MRFKIETEINESGNRVFKKYRIGKNFAYEVKAENGESFPADKNWILQNQKSIVNLGVSGDKIYPVDMPGEKKSNGALVNKAWLLNLYSNCFPNGAENVNFEVSQRTKSKRLVITNSANQMVMTEDINKNKVNIYVAANGSVMVNMDVQGSLDSLGISHNDFVLDSNIRGVNEDFYKVRVARVKFGDKDKEYCYDCGDLDVSVGDRVWVPVGDYGHRTEAKVVKIEIFDEDKCPYYNLKEIEEVL